MHPVAFELFQVYKDGYNRSVFLAVCMLAAFAAAGVSYCLVEAPCQKIACLFQGKQKKI